MKNRCMKNGMMIIVAVLLVAMAFAGAGAADVPAEMNGKNWMSYIPDSTSLGEINIPGTHDSGMWDCAEPIAGIFSITQNAGHNVMAQFDDGCRWFDMRYDTVKDKTDWTIGETSSTKDVHVTHGGFRSVWERHGLIVTETLLFTHVVNNLLYSCYSNNECVVITLQCEKGNDEYAKNVVKDTVNSLCTNNPDMFIQLKNGDPLPALGDVRGKIIFIHSGQYSKTHDHYQVDEKNPADVKWNELVTHWNTINKT